MYPMHDIVGNRYGQGAPASVQLALGDDRVLRASVCINGRCFDGSANLGPLIDELAASIASYHQGLHTPEAVAELAQETNDLVESAGEMLIGNALLVGFGWDDITSAASSVGNAVASAAGDSYHAVAKTVSDHEADLKKLAIAGAAAGAGALLGPEAAPIAASLASNAIDATLGKPKAAAALHAAATNPHTAQIAQIAHDATAAAILQRHQQVKAGTAPAPQKKGINPAIPVAAGLGGLALLLAIL
jgi:hypothetical protein